MSEERIRRERMVSRHLEGRGIDDPRVLAAMRDIPRHRFVDEALGAKAYGDHALPIGHGQTISQPWIVAYMSQLLRPKPQDTILEIGTGSGYHAAVLSRLVARVFTLERIPELTKRARRVVRSLGIENVHFKVFDGTYGWSEFAPYSAMVVTAACPEIPAPLLEQLAKGGRLVVPVGTPDGQMLRCITRQGPRDYVGQDHGRVEFVPLLGRFGFPA